MIVGHIDTLQEGREEYPEPVRKALEFLRAHDFTNMEDGEYAIDGKRSFAKLQRYRTRPAEACRPESHEKYLDIQYMVEGEEYLGWCPFSPDLEIAEPYDEKADVTFYRALVPDSSIVMTAGDFAVLYPSDVHRPGVQVHDEPHPVTKVIVKIDMDVFGRL